MGGQGLSPRVIVVLAAAACGLAAGLSARAAPDDGAYIKARRDAYRDMGEAFKAINDALKAPAPDLGAIRPDVEAISQMAADQYHWFRPGSGPESGEKTGALPTIWAQPGRFKAAEDAFAAQARAFAKIAAGEDAGAARAAAKQLAAACKACHEDFRRKEE